VHVFHAAASWVPEARLAIDEIGSFVRGLVGQEVAETAAAPATTHPRTARAAVR
jgi:hypothetical protein